MDEFDQAAEAPEKMGADWWLALLECIPSKDRLAGLLLLVIALPLAYLAYHKSAFAGWTVILGIVIAAGWFSRNAYKGLFPAGRKCPVERHHRLLSALQLCEDGLVKGTRPGHLSKLLGANDQTSVRKALDELANCHRR